MLLLPSSYLGLAKLVVGGGKEGGGHVGPHQKGQVLPHHPHAVARAVLLEHVVDEACLVLPELDEVPEDLFAGEQEWCFKKCIRHGIFRHGQINSTRHAASAVRRKSPQEFLKKCHIF